MRKHFLLFIGSSLPQKRRRSAWSPAQVDPDHDNDRDHEEVHDHHSDDGHDDIHHNYHRDTIRLKPKKPRWKAILNRG